MAGWVSDVTKFVNDLQATITGFDEGRFCPFYFLHGSEKVSYFSMLLADMIEDTAVLPEHRHWNYYKVILSSSDRFETLRLSEVDIDVTLSRALNEIRDTLLV